MIKILIIALLGISILITIISKNQQNVGATNHQFK